MAGGEPVQRPGAAADEQHASGGVGIVQRQGADVGRAQRVHPGKQDDEPLGGVVQTAEQAGAQAVIQRQDRRRLDPAAGQRRGGIGEQHAAGLQRAEQRPHRRQRQQPGRAGQRGELAGHVVGGDLPQRLIPCGPAGQRGLQDAHVSMDGAGLPGPSGAGPAALQRLGPGAHVGRERRGQGREPGRQPLLEGGLRAGPGQALVGEELHSPQRGQAPLDQEPPDIRGVPRRLAELLPAVQHGEHRAAGMAQRVQGPAAGLPVADQRVQRRPGGRAGPRRAPGCAGLPAQCPGGAGGELAGPARPRLADRLLPPAPGQVPAGCAQRNSRQARHSPYSSLVRSPQSRQAPVTLRDFASHADFPGLVSAW